jgi:hypothetical protein
VACHELWEIGLGDEARVDEHMLAHRPDAAARESTAGPRKRTG